MNLSSQVVKFTTACSTDNSVPKYPRPMSPDRIRFVTRMIISELMELATTVTDDPVTFVQECIKTDLPRKYTGTSDIDKLAYQLDACVDILYYLGDSAARDGINLDPGFTEVHAANMNKIGPDGKVIRREDGKIMKPPGWQEPDIHKVVERQMKEGSWNL